MGCLLSVLEFKEKNYNEKIKVETAVYDSKIDSNFNYNYDSDYSPPRYNKLYGWD